MDKCPIVGQVVRLNDEGIQQIGGIASHEAYRQSQKMTILSVSDNLTRPEETYAIEVDQPLMNFIITNWDVEEIQE